jgi:hypothetical protein
MFVIGGRSMVRSLLRAIPFVVLGLATLSAQQKPNVSGRWVGVSPSEAAGQEQFVKHEGTTLTTSHASEGDGHRAVYSLDGKESRNVIVSHGEEIVTMSQAAWNGPKLTLTSATTYPDGRKMRSTQIWSLDAEGRLVIEFSQTMDGQPAMTMTVVSVKK